MILDARKPAMTPMMIASSISVASLKVVVSRQKTLDRRPYQLRALSIREVRGTRHLEQPRVRQRGYPFLDQVHGNRLLFPMHHESRDLKRAKPRAQIPVTVRIHDDAVSDPVAVANAGGIGRTQIR